MGQRKTSPVLAAAAGEAHEQTTSGKLGKTREQYIAIYTLDRYFREIREVLAF
jgi:hypothetical protein